MKIRIFTFLTILFLTVFNLIIAQTRTVKNLTDWKFTRDDNSLASQVQFDDSKWQSITVPHDWAIYGPFDKEVDKQTIRITQNNEKNAFEKTGRTGALPFIGVGWYRTTVEVPELADDKQVLLAFDGAMSNPKVFVNGTEVGHWAYGYAYFYFDITSNLKKGEENVIAVRLENQPLCSRWYPGAGLYRKVQVIITDEISFQRWGQYITTPYVSSNLAKINVKATVPGIGVEVKVNIKDADGKVVAQGSSSECFGNEIEQSIAVENPKLWSPETPYLYTAELELYKDGELKDSEIHRIGIRTIKYSSEKGFELNGKVRKFKGVCLHHDLGPIGAAINKAALKRQLTILKEMGCDAIRSSHNMPSMEQLELCDEMGFMFLAESFDEWKKPKVKNGYNLYFDEWAEKDIVNLVRATRNHPCIVMWSAGNEVPDQHGSEGVKRAKWIQNIFHREDPTRPVTVGMDQVKTVMESGFGSVLDVPGLNYRVHLYEEAFDKFPQGFLLGSETASTVSSRGVYKFPVEQFAGKEYDDGQCSSYDFEYCNWSNLPEIDFEMQDDKPWVIGEFVWTGFDYLGEPTPYDGYWPSRSSYFGICDLAGLPKDRYYLYRSRWNTEDATLHILPHWNWEGKEGDTIPVFVYTSYNSAELFINGKSQGVQKKTRATKFTRYRLMWMNTVYEPGTIKVVAYDDNGNAVSEKSIVTAGKPHHIELEADRKTITANGNDLSFVTATVVDKDGNLCPTVSNQLKFKVEGAGTYRAACNGDATSLEIFHKPTMKAFNGKVVILVQSSKEVGNITLTVSGDNLEDGEIEISSQK